METANEPFFPEACLVSSWMLSSSAYSIFVEHLLCATSCI